MSQAPDYAFDHIGVVVQFGQDGSGIVYELVAPLGPDSPIQPALDKGHNLLNHVAYRTADLALAAGALRSQGCFPLGPAAPAVAFGGQLVQFFLTPLRIILEVVQGAGPVHCFNQGLDGGPLTTD